ncbi:hypothetical protein D3C75_734470 [compost metagenome]
MLAEIVVGFALVGIELVGDFQLLQQVDGGCHGVSSGLNKARQSAPEGQMWQVSAFTPHGGLCSRNRMPDPMI